MMPRKGYGRLVSTPLWPPRHCRECRQNGFNAPRAELGPCGASFKACTCWHSSRWATHDGLCGPDPVNYLPVFFVAAAVSMGNVLEASKGLDVLTDAVFGSIAPFLGNIVSTTAIMYWAGFIYHFFLASEISMLGTSMPLVMAFAKSHGMNPLMLGLIWTFSAGGKLFAYQSGVLIVGYSYGYFEARDLIRIGAWLTVVEFVILMLLVPFYWPLIGIY
jgi:hypothetical protein